MSAALHGSGRSPASYRARIVPNFKGLDFVQRAWHLRQGEQSGPRHRTIASRGLVRQNSNARCLGRDLDALDRALPEHRPDADGDVA
jgi:hypothetical protein